MGFDDLKKDLIEADVDIRSYLENSEEYFKLKIFKALMRAVTSFTHFFLLGALMVMGLFFISLALSYVIGDAMGNTLYGFFIVGAFYLVVAVLCYIFRGRLDRPLLRKFSRYYFE